MKNNCLVFLIHGKSLHDLFENCLISLKNTNITIDKIAYCSSQSIESYRDICNRYSVRQLPIDIDSDAKDYSPFETTAFKIVTSYKWEIILNAMAQGYENVIYTDTDIFFLRNFDSYISSISKVYDLGVQSESQPTFPITACTGFMFFNRRAKIFLEQLMKVNTSDRVFDNDQGVFNELLKRSPQFNNKCFFFPESIFQNGLHYKNYLKGKKLFFMDIELKPFLFHANYVRGLKFKIKLLKKLGLWLLPKRKRTSAVGKHVTLFIYSVVKKIQRR